MEATAVSLGGAAAAMAYAVRGPSATLLAPSIHRGSPDRKVLALTFDDGPSESTEEVLKILQEHSVPATFFQCGLNAGRLPRVTRSVVSEGHEIGNHSQTHARLYFQPPTVIEREFAGAQQTLGQILGKAPRLMRPPFGVRWFGFREMQKKLELLSIMWTAIGLDWKLKSTEIAARLLRDSCNGGILCLHDGRELQKNPDVSQTPASLARTSSGALGSGLSI